jgi:hypothetical protein
MRSCINCGYCKVLITLKPLKKRSRRWRHGDLFMEEFINSRLSFKSVRCVAGMWTKHDGGEFQYKKLSDMMLHPDTGRLTFAEKCMRYDP